MNNKNNSNELTHEEQRHEAILTLITYTVLTLFITLVTAVLFCDGHVILGVLMAGWELCIILADAEQCVIVRELLSEEDHNTNN